jgi:diguanylate cyclase (GGDEF)-like protein
LVEAHLIELRERLSALEALAAVDQLILAGADLEPVVDVLLEGMTSVMRCEQACIALPSSDAPGLWDLHLEVAGAARAVARRQAGADPGRPRLGPIPAALRKAGARVVRAWPVTLETRVVAIIGVGFRAAGTLDPTLDDTLDGFAQRLSLALARNEREERLYRQAHFDALTGLPNRLLFREHLAGDFKQVNDTLGHAAGDQLLTLAGQRLRGCVKERDTVARLGGDEFTVILRALPEPSAAQHIAERIVGTLAAPMWVGGEPRRAGVSIGIAVFPDDARDGDELVSLADAAMYRAKQQGRDRIAWHRPR